MDRVYSQLIAFTLVFLATDAALLAADSHGTGPNDLGVRFYYDWVGDHVGRWEYPKHVKNEE